MIKQCVICGEAFDGGWHRRKKKFCSKKCCRKSADQRRASRRKKQRIASRPQLLCEACGGTFVGNPKRKTCSAKCRLKKQNENRAAWRLRNGWHAPIRMKQASPPQNCIVCELSFNPRASNHVCCGDPKCKATHYGRRKVDPIARAKRREYVRARYHADPAFRLSLSLAARAQTAKLQRDPVRYAARLASQRKAYRERTRRAWKHRIHSITEQINAAVGNKDYTES